MIMQLNEERNSNIMEFVKQMKQLPFVDEILDVKGLPDGFTLFFRGEDGNAYEIEMRPASFAKNHDDIRKAGSYMERRRKKLEKLRKDMNI
jgi:hypothetical protein